jgi:hypothetical protein
MQSQTISPNRVLWIVGGVVVVLIIIGAVLSSGREPASFEAGSPEHTAQEYLTAVLDRDFDLAREFLTPELSESCAMSLERPWVPDSARIVLLDVRESDDRVRVLFEITESNPGVGLDLGEYSYEESLTMEQRGDTWLIAEVPWPMYYCEGVPTP